MPFNSPSNSAPHPDWHDLLAGYALGNLSPQEQATLKQLLTQQPELKAEIVAYQETLASIPYALEPKSLPHGLEEAIVTAAKQPRLAAPPTTTARSWFRRRSWYPAAAAAAACLMAIMGGDNYRLRQQQTALKTQLATAQSEQQTLTQKLDEATASLAEFSTQKSFKSVVDILRQPNALVYSLQGTDTAATSSGSLLTLPNHSEVQLVSHNLPVLPTGQVYRLWSVATETSAPMFCGQFNNTDAGNVQWTVPDALCNAKPVKVIITVDAVVDPPVPKGPAVLTGEI